MTLGLSEDVLQLSVIGWEFIFFHPRHRPDRVLRAHRLPRRTPYTRVRPNY